MVPSTAVGFLYGYSLADRVCGLPLALPGDRRLDACAGVSRPPDPLLVLYVPLSGPLRPLCCASGLFLPHWWPGGGLHFVVRLPLASAEEVALSTGLRQQKRVAMPITCGADAHSMTSDLPQLLPGFLFCGPGHWVELD